MRREDLARRVDPDLARIEHLQAEDVELVRRAGADDLGERRDADAHQLAALALLLLLAPQVVVADELHRQLEGRRVVARVVLPARRGLVRELVRLDEVVHPELGRVLVDLVGQDVDHALDRMDRFRDPERAAVGDTAGRLVRVDAVDLDERVVEVVGAGDHVEEAGRELRGIGRGVGVAVVGDGLDLEAGDLAVLRGTQLGVDVVVASEGIRLEVLRAILDPLDGLAGGQARHHGQDIARVHGHLAAEAAADVVGLDADVLLRQPADEGEHGAGWHAAPGDVMWSVSSPRIASQSAMQPHVSIEATWMRGM